MGPPTRGPRPNGRFGFDRWGGGGGGGGGGGVSYKVYIGQQPVGPQLDSEAGGDEVILAEAGKDATEAFEDVGHSDGAPAYLPGIRIGEFEKDANEAKAKLYQSTAAAAAMDSDNAVQQTSNLFHFVPLAAIVAYFAWRFYS